MLYPFVLIFAIISLFVDMPWGEETTIIIIMIFIIPIFISFFILPGLLYEDGYKYAWHGFGKNQVHYNLFFGFTLGLGPMYVFLKNYDPILKEYFKKNKEKS